MVFSYKPNSVLNTILILLAINCQGFGCKNTTIEMSSIFSCTFEVFGHVQGVFFRKYTEKQAIILGVRGWCMNTKDGTVCGELEAPIGPLNLMKHWLETEGSPSCKITKVVFSEVKEIEGYTFNEFRIRK